MLKIPNVVLSLLISLLLASLVAVGWSSVAWALDPISFIRTPDTQFENLPGYTFAPHYLTVDGDLRMHYVDTGPAHAPPILLLHGEPSWSYLYRKMIPPLAAAGYRVIAPDLIGFGRSDKPTNRSDYTYTRHVNWVAELLLALDLQQVTLFCQDWGGLIGLRLVALHPDRFSGVIAGNTGLSGGPPVTIGPPSHPEPEGLTFAQWLEYSQTVPVFDAGIIIQGGTASTLSGPVVDAYRAPFPNNDETYLAGAREFPTLVGTDLAESQAAWAVLQSWTKPFLTTFSDGDRITWGNELSFIEHVPGAANEPHVIVQNARHFLQEDKDEELVALILDFLARNGPPAPVDLTGAWELTYECGGGFNGTRFFDVTGTAPNFFVTPDTFVCGSSKRGAQGIFAVTGCSFTPDPVDVTTNGSGGYSQEQAINSVMWNPTFTDPSCGSAAIDETQFDFYVADGVYSPATGVATSITGTVTFVGDLKYYSAESQCGGAPLTGVVCTFDGRRNGVQPGANQVVEPIEGVRVTFQSVLSPGKVYATILSQSTNALPGNFVFVEPALVFQITTSADFEPGAEVCLPYPDENPADGIVDGTNLTPLQLTILKDGVPQPGLVQGPGNSVCVEVTGFSEFALGFTAAAVPALSSVGLGLLLSVVNLAGIVLLRRRA